MALGTKHTWVLLVQMIEFLINQVGDLNAAHLVNFNGTGNDVDVFQNGDENTTVVESSYPNTALTSNDNNIDIMQSGVANETMVTLAGILDSNANRIDISQTGEINLVDIMVEGSGHSIDISQEGEGNWVTGMDQSAFLIAGEDVSFTVNQIGNDNLVRGGIIGSNNMVFCYANW